VDQPVRAPPVREKFSIWDHYFWWCAPGPGQKPAFDNAMALVGCPDRRIDRLCITCCSPSQPSHHAGLFVTLALARPSARRPAVIHQRAATVPLVVLPVTTLQTPSRSTKVTGAVPHASK
jgi:hypothetical protein